MAEVSRRELVKGSAGLTAAAALGYGALGLRAESAAAAPAQRAYRGMVLRQEHPSLRVTVPAADRPGAIERTARVPSSSFPPNWKFRVGDQVLVRRDATGRPSEALPLVGRVIGRLDSCRENAGVRTLSVGGVQAVVNEGSGFPDGSPEKVAARQDTRLYLLHYIDNDVDGLPSCFGFRLATRG